MHKNKIAYFLTAYKSIVLSKRAFGKIIYKKNAYQNHNEV